MGSQKRKPDGTSSNEAIKSARVNLVKSERIRVLKEGPVGDGPILYWMSRDQRSKDNWALLYAAQVAQEKGQRVAVCFNLVTEYLHAGARQFVFMLKGLRQVAPELEKRNIRFHLLEGDPQRTVPQLASDLGAGMVVVDMTPTRLGRQWREGVKEAVGCPLHEVDAHNIVPVWVASDKREYAARTIRRKIHAKLPDFLDDFPDVPATLPGWSGDSPAIEWDRLIEEARERGAAVPEIDHIPSGEAAALDALTGKSGFLGGARFKNYAGDRNDPNKADGLSGMSPYFHFGQLAPQRAALEVRKVRKASPASADAFLEESIVRRELSDNFCFYEPNYDSLSAASSWARETLEAHRNDKREHLYSMEELEEAKTHDPLWNAAQREMTHLGKMHGFMRMYWAKKILEWTESPEQALKWAITLNDKYEIDGRDPNGWVGCMWSICGIHDQGWAERAVFGKIRFMNYNGCKRKFDIDRYVKSVESRIKKGRK